jgi:hypothetical protein
MSASVIEAVFEIRALTIHGGPDQRLSGKFEKASRTYPSSATKETVKQRQIS